MTATSRVPHRTLVGALPALMLSAVLTLVAGCATTEPPLAQVSVASSARHLHLDRAVDSCRSAIGSASTAQGAVLDGREIRLTNWNIKKKSRPDWQQDLHRLTRDADLVLMQEAALREDTVVELDGTRYWSFAPGYRHGTEISGVMTLSNVAPLTQCSFAVVEPLLGTPKATSITQFGLADTDRTLVVVNLHAVNFSLGLRTFRAQFAAVSRALELHRGPLIVSGDFNTWRGARARVVAELAAELGLAPVEFDVDHRLSVLGRPLDHIYVRGLETLESRTVPVATSDHNPMSARLRL